MKSRDKKPMLFIALLFVVCFAVGGTLAYYTTSDTFTNVFNVSTYGVDVSEVFESPNNWQPGDITEKVISVKNTGETPVAVRVKLEQSWQDKDGNPLPLADSEGTEAAKIWFNNSYLVYWPSYLDPSSDEYNKTEYFYYYKALGTNEETETLMNAVGYNPYFIFEETQNCEINPDTHTTTCISTLDGHAGGTYTLKITVETC